MEHLLCFSLQVLRICFHGYHVIKNKTDQYMNVWCVNEGIDMVDYQN